MVTRRKLTHKNDMKVGGRINGKYEGVCWSGRKYEINEVNILTK